MNRIPPVLVALVLSLLPASPAHGQVVSFADFASFNAGTLTTVQATFEAFPVAPANLGSAIVEGCMAVSFNPSSTPGGGTKGIAVLDTGSPLSPPPSSRVLSAHGNEDLTLTFGASCLGPTAVGFETYTNGSAPPRVTIVDSMGTITTFALTQPPNTLGFVGVISPLPIVSVRWLATQGHIADTAIDNVRVGTAQPTLAPPQVEVSVFGTQTQPLLNHHVTEMNSPYRLSARVLNPSRLLK